PGILQQVAQADAPIHQPDARELVYDGVVVGPEVKREQHRVHTGLLCHLLGTPQGGDRVATVAARAQATAGDEVVGFGQPRAHYPPAKPFGFSDCQRQESAAASSMLRVAFQPRSLSARETSA